MEKIPVKLKTDPILEAIFELRFRSADTAAADRLLATLYSPLRTEFPKLERLAASELPVELLKLDPNLRFQPRMRIFGKQFAILLGDHSMMVSALDPYAGWKTGFRDTIVGALNLVKESGVIETVDRFSLKYVNLLQADSVPKQFSMTQLSATLGSRNLLGCLTNIRSEFEEGGFTNIIEMLPNSTAQAPGQKLTGVLLNVDTISFDTKDFWANFETRIDAAHATEKRIFFSMLTPETIDAFGPIYGE